jgi:hypothetical protein
LLNTRRNLFKLIMLYNLTETYSEIYDHRKVEDLFDNLRFVDYMLQEDIEQVVEELVWEFRDYGNTLQEAFEMIDYALEDTVICESYNQLIEDVLYEAAKIHMLRLVLLLLVNILNTRLKVGHDKENFLVIQVEELLTGLVD